MEEELIFEHRIKRFFRRDLVIRLWVNWETRSFRGEYDYD